VKAAVTATKRHAPPARGVAFPQPVRRIGDLLGRDVQGQPWSRWPPVGRPSLWPTVIHCMRNSRHDQRGNSTDHVQTMLRAVPGTPQELHEKRDLFRHPCHVATFDERLDLQRPQRGARDLLTAASWNTAMRHAEITSASPSTA